MNKLLQVQTVAAPIIRRLREVSLILLMAFAVFIFVSLITYDITDPGWSKTATTVVIENAAGKVGAWTADLFLYIFGYLAYLFPFVLMSIGIGFIRKQDHTIGFNLPLWLLHFGGFVCTVVAGSGLATLHLSAFNAYVPDDAGGVIGRMIGTLLVPIFNYLGSTLILLAAFLIGATLMTGLSWLHCMNGARKGLLLSCQTGVKCFPTLLQKMLVLWQGLKNKKTEHKADTESHITKQEPTIPLVNRKIQSTTQEPVKKEEAIDLPASPTRIRVVTVETKPEKAKVTPLKKNTGALPDVALLESGKPSEQVNPSTPAFLESLSRLVETKLLDFGVAVTVVAVCPGPVITRFELELAAGLKVSKISALAKDLARALSVTRVRVVEVIPGKTVVGLEIPNAQREIVRLREVLESSQYASSHSPISLALGKDIAGRPAVVDLAKMPHLLVAGTTGSGKSVGINMMLLSILYKATPEDVRLILIDPKMLELSIYDGIAHLLTPVVTDMKDAANALRWCVAEMERRYQLMAALGVRNLVNFNQKVDDANKAGKPLLDPLYQPEADSEPATLQRLPYIVIIIDEFADMMMVVGKKVEELIARIAQKARAAGIHMILATQRPSVDVITGLIKANVPTRIAFQVSSRIDSRTILDQQGAEQLLGHGDMLYLPPGSGVPIRIHGAFVTDEEVHKVVAELKKLGEPHFVEDILESKNYSSIGSSRDNSEENADDLFDEAVQIVVESKRASISHLQRRLKIGYNRSARLIEMMESAGIVSSVQNNGMREVLISKTE